MQMTMEDDANNMSPGRSNSQDSSACTVSGIHHRSG